VVVVVVVVEASQEMRLQLQMLHPMGQLPQQGLVTSPPSLLASGAGLPAVAKPLQAPRPAGGTKARASAAAFAAALPEEHDEQQQQQEEEQEHSDATTHVPAPKGKRPAASRARKSAAAAAAAAAAEKDHGKEAGTAQATAVGESDAADKAAPATAAAADRHAAASGGAKAELLADAAVKPVVPGVKPGVGGSSMWDAVQEVGASGCVLLEQLQPWLPAAWAVLGAVAVVALFVCGLPAVLQPAGYSQAALG